MQAILRHTAIDKWTGKNKTFTLEVPRDFITDLSPHPHKKANIAMTGQ